MLVRSDRHLVVQTMSSTLYHYAVGSWNNLVKFIKAARQHGSIIAPKQGCNRDVSGVQSLINVVAVTQW